MKDFLDLADVDGEFGGVLDRQVARPRQVDLQDPLDAPRARRDDADPGGRSPKTSPPHYLQIVQKAQEVLGQLKAGYSFEKTQAFYAHRLQGEHANLSFTRGVTI